MSIDWSKPVQTRDGRKARVLCTDRKCAADDEPVIALINENGIEQIYEYLIDGRWIHESLAYSTHDLINVPAQKKKMTVDVGLWLTPDGQIVSASRIVGGNPFPNGMRFVSTIQTIEMEYEEPQP